MKTRVNSIGYLAVSVLFCVLIVVLLSPMIHRARGLSKRDGCKNGNLGNAIRCALFTSGEWGSSPTNPATLAGLDPGDISPSCLICPQAEASRGCPWPADEVVTLRDMDKWTDYIYVSGLLRSNTSILPIVICPPINHLGKGGNVLFTDWRRKWIPSPEIDKLIDWTYAYAESNGLRIVVSEALTKRSNGRYRSRP